MVVTVAAPPASAEAPCAHEAPLLIVAEDHERYKSLDTAIQFVSSEREALCAAVTQPQRYRAVIARVAGADGRQGGYSLVMTLRKQLQMLCPIFLLTRAPTHSSRAYALQCGATDLLADDQDLIEVLRGRVAGIEVVQA
jgi:DNA-binding response OmpR family regulator